MKQYLKDNYKFIICLFLLIIVLTFKFPYYIDAPGGISDMSKKIEINGYESKGSFNIVFVKEYQATIPTLIISLFNKDWDVIKQDDVLLDNESDSDYLMRDKILMKEAISNSIYIAYKYAKKDIKVKSNKLYVTYIDINADTSLKVGDEILSINGVSIYKKEDVTNVIDGLNIGSKLNIKVKNNNKEYNRYAYIKEEKNDKKIGILISNIRDYETNPNIKVNIDSNESGSSGGLITALSIYDSLVSEDITHGLTIVGTGTIDLNGNIGSIGGVEYKLKSAVKNNADLFIVPNGENYDESIRLKNKNNYNIEIIGVDTFDETLKYLENLKINRK